MSQSLLFIPGTLCNELLFENQTTHFSNLGYQCQVASLDGGNTIAAMAQSILSAAPARFALVGLSMGGIIAFEILRRAPHRVTHLALLDTNALPETPTKADARTQVINDIDKDVDAIFLPFVEESLYPNYVAEPCEKIKATVVKMAAQVGWPVGRQQMQALNTRPDSTHSLLNVDVPATIICGEDDVLCPIERHLLIQKHIKDSELSILPNCGHLSTLEQPEQVNAILERWLEA